jgi:hypothetical protein
VIAATGYRPDLRRLAFLDSGMREAVAQIVHTPLLSDHFETSLPGLFALGPLAAVSFGPVMNFLAGTAFAVPRLAAHLVRTRRMVATPGDLQTANPAAAAAE